MEQQIIALTLVTGAALYLVRGWIVRLRANSIKKPGCAGGCGCAAGKPAVSLKPTRSSRSLPVLERR